MLAAAQTINLALAFILELAMLAAFAYWGFVTGQSTMAKIVLGIGVPVLVAALWGVFMAPNSARRLQGGTYLALKCILFACAATALLATGRTAAGIALAIVFVANTVLLYIWQQ
jgi:hypothetical protein